MARSRQSRNGRLVEALATALQTQATTQQTQASLQQNQASLQQTLTAFLAQMAEMKADSDRRFARIEAILLDHTRILQEHRRILQTLPDAVREKIGSRLPDSHSRPLSPVPPGMSATQHVGVGDACARRVCRR